MAVAAANAGEFSTMAAVCSDGDGVNAGNAAASRSSENDASERTSDLSRQAPIGHRQLRANDVPAKTQSSPSELEQRRLVQDLDRRLIICRRC